MVREHLSALTIEGGHRLLLATDQLGMQAQGAMWVLNHQLKDWRFYLITSLVDSMGRRRTYKALLDIFEFSNFGEGITPDDVHLASPNDELFATISHMFRIEGGTAEFNNCSLNGVPFDGLIYRSVASQPNEDDAHKIEKRFLKQLKNFVANRGKPTSEVDIKLRKAKA